MYHFLCWFRWFIALKIIVLMISLLFLGLWFQVELFSMFSRTIWRLFGNGWIFWCFSWRGVILFAVLDDESLVPDLYFRCFPLHCFFSFNFQTYEVALSSFSVVPFDFVSNFFCIETGKSISRSLGRTWGRWSSLHLQREHWLTTQIMSPMGELLRHRP